MVDSQGSSRWIAGSEATQWEKLNRESAAALICGPTDQPTVQRKPNRVPESDVLNMEYKVEVLTAAVPPNEWPAMMILSVSIAPFQRLQSQ